MVIQMLIGLFGGLGMFLYGMKRCSDGLQKIAAHKLKQMIKMLTKSPTRGVLVGIIVTMALQSSSATCIIVVGFVGASLMSLTQSLGILLGSALGSSLTVQLIAFKITYLALSLIFIGAMIYLFAKKSQKRSLGQILLGFGKNTHLGDIDHMIANSFQITRDQENHACLIYIFGAFFHIPG